MTLSSVTCRSRGGGGAVQLWHYSTVDMADAMQLASFQVVTTYIIEDGRKKHETELRARFPCHVLPSPRRTCSKELRSQRTTLNAPTPPAEVPTSTTVEVCVWVPITAFKVSLATDAHKTQNTRPRK